jgi:hypothetical protein
VISWADTGTTLESTVRPLCPSFGVAILDHGLQNRTTDLAFAIPWDNRVARKTPAIPRLMFDPEAEVGNTREGDTSHSRKFVICCSTAAAMASNFSIGF